MIQDIEIVSRIRHSNEMIKRAFTSFLFFSAVIVSSPSLAEWVEIGSTEDGSSTWYYDSTRVFKNNGFINYWELTDYASEDGYGYLSDVTRVVLDCGAMRFKNVQIVNYRGRMGTGKTMGEGKRTNEWNYPLPGTIKEMAITTVCKLHSK